MSDDSVAISRITERVLVLYTPQLLYNAITVYAAILNHLLYKVINQVLAVKRPIETRADKKNIVFNSSSTSKS